MSAKLKQIGLVLTGVLTGILISLHVPAIAEKETPFPLPFDELRTFTEVFSAIKTDYVEPVSDKTLLTYAISGMLSGLDPHSTYLDADAFKDLQVNTQGEFGGLGIEVGMEEGFIKVVSPIEDTPAYRAGIKAGDLIVKLDDTPVKGLSLSDAVKRMRGKPKTKITLTIARKGETKPIIVTLTREVIKVQSVKSKLLESGYAYVRITQFQEDTTTALAKHLSKLDKPETTKTTKDSKENKDSQEIKGLVLDLRNDPGGLLHSAIGVSAAFLQPKMLVVSTNGRTEDAKHEYFASSDDYLRGSGYDMMKNLPAWTKTVPIVILVNSGSASASEIVAGALQDHKRAIILGTQSFGKGSVQTILPLRSNTAIKLTTARYYTPNGRSIQAKGIVPDIIVEESPNGDGNLPHLREADLERHLLNDKDHDESAPVKQKSIAPTSPESAKSKDKTKDSEEEAPLEFASKKDYQLNQAITLLKGLHVVQGR